MDGFGTLRSASGGQVDDGVLQALAGVDRHQLDGGGVGVEPAGALGAAAGRGPRLTWPRSQVSSATSPSRSVRRDLVQRLADVAQVGELPLAADPRRAPAPAGPPTFAASSTAATPRLREQLGPGAQRVGDLVGEPVAAARRARSAVWPRKQVSAAARTRALRCGCSSASSSSSHSTAAGVANTLPPPAITAGTPDRVQRRAGVGEVGVAVGDHRDVARLERHARRTSRPTRAGPRTSSARSRAMCGRTWPIGERRCCRACRTGRGARTRSRNGASVGRAGQPGPVVVGGRRRARRSAGRRARHRRAPLEASRAAAASLRQLTGSVCFVVAVSAAGGRSRRRRRGTRRSPASGRRSAPSWRGR